MQDAGAFPWFFGRDFKMAFFRPLSSLLLAVDHELWGLWPVGYVALGEVVELDGMRAKVLARSGRGPTRVEFRFDRPLDDPELYFLAWQGSRLRHVVLPPIGEEISL